MKKKQLISLIVSLVVFLSINAMAKSDSDNLPSKNNLWDALKGTSWRNIDASPKQIENYQFLTAETGVKLCSFSTTYNPDSIVKSIFKPNPFRRSPVYTDHGFMEVEIIDVNTLKIGNTEYRYSKDKLIAKKDTPYPRSLVRINLQEIIDELWNNSFNKTTWEVEKDPDNNTCYFYIDNRTGMKKCMLTLYGSASDLIQLSSIPSEGFDVKFINEHVVRIGEIIYWFGGKKLVSDSYTLSPLSPQVDKP